MQGLRHEKRWPRIQAKRGTFVNPPERLAPVRAQVAFPILAMAPGLRHAGIVCLDGRMQVIVARSVRVRDWPVRDVVARRLADELTYEVGQRSPATIVVGHDARSVEGSLNPLLETARALGRRTYAVAYADAYERILTGGAAHDIAAVLVRRYEQLRVRIAPSGTLLVHNERWREAMPLMMAFALAHAMALDVITTATGALGSVPPDDYEDSSTS